MEWIEFCQKIKKIIPDHGRLVDINCENDKITYKIGEDKFEYTLEEYLKLKDNLTEVVFDSFSLADPNNYAVLVESIDMGRHFPLSISSIDEEDAVSTVDNENNITYEIRPISDEFLWFVIKSLDDERRMPMRTSMSWASEKIRSMPNKSLFDIIRIIHRLPVELHLSSPNVVSYEKMENYANSYLFNFAYNTDCVLRKISTLDSVFPKRIFRHDSRHRNYREIESPKLAYKQELVEQYYMAVASSDPFIKFIGYYHIIEHFYDDVYADEIINNVKEIIQSPGFSSKRKKDLMKIIDLVKVKTRQGKEGYVGTESEALELTLKKYVSVHNLIEELNNIDESLVAYYSHNEVPFSKGDAFDLNDIQNRKLYKKIAARIYKTRNSLVHYKSNEIRINERGIYQPFKNNQELLKEIPLMRCIAELIIIKTAKDI